MDGNLGFTLKAFPSTLRIPGAGDPFRQGDPLAAQCRRRHRRRGGAGTQPSPRSGGSSMTRRRP